MIVAVDAGGQRLVASESVRGRDVFCPACATPVQVRVPAARVAHFAHQAGVHCRPAGTRRRPARAVTAAPGGQETIPGLYLPGNENPTASPAAPVV